MLLSGLFPDSKPDFLHFIVDRSRPRVSARMRLGMNFLFSPPPVLHHSLCAWTGIKRKRGSMAQPDPVLTARRKALLNAKDAPSPSSASKPIEFITEQLKRPVFNGRYNFQGDDLRVGAPVTLYHRVFSQFQDDLQVPLDPMELDTKYLSDVNTLCGQSSALYSSEAERQSHVMKTLGTVLGFFFKTRMSDLAKNDAKSDGVVSIECGSGLETAFILILELKNEIGVGGCDPAIQALQSYRKYWLKVSREKCLMNYDICLLTIFVVSMPLREFLLS